MFTKEKLKLKLKASRRTLKILKFSLTKEAAFSDLLGCGGFAKFFSDISYQLLKPHPTLDKREVEPDNLFNFIAEKASLLDKH